MPSSRKLAFAAAAVASWALTAWAWSAAPGTDLPAALPVAGVGRGACPSLIEAYVDSAAAAADAVGSRSARRAIEVRDATGIRYVEAGCSLGVLLAANHLVAERAAGLAPP